MKIVILGAGKIGSYVASLLSLEEHDVTLIDQNSKVLEQLGREVDVATRHAKAPNFALFQELAEMKPDLFFAATGSDETNLVSCSIAKKLGVPKTIARIQSEEYSNSEKFDFKRLFSVDHFAQAEILAAQEVFQTIVHSGDIASAHFAHGTILMRTFHLPDTWDRAHIPISLLGLPKNLIIGMIRRKVSGEETSLVPHGDDTLLPGDEVAIVGDTKTMDQVHTFFRLKETPLKSAILFGGTLITEHLAHFLLAQKVGVRIVDSNLEKCEELAEKFPNATILNRGGGDPQFLKEERIQDADVSICCTHHDGTNLLIAAMAKQLGCPKTIALIANPAFTPILDKLGVIPALSVRVNLGNRILSILHEDTILSVGSLCNDQAKIVELKITSHSKCIGIPLSKLKLPKRMLIAVIQSESGVSIGKGTTELQAGDTVIVICPHELIEELPGIFH